MYTIFIIFAYLLMRQSKDKTKKKSVKLFFSDKEYIFENCSKKIENGRVLVVKGDKTIANFPLENTLLL